MEVVVPRAAAKHRDEGAATVVAAVSRQSTLLFLETTGEPGLSHELDGKPHRTTRLAVWHGQQQLSVVKSRDVATYNVPQGVVRCASEVRGYTAATPRTAKFRHWRSTFCFATVGNQ